MLKTAFAEFREFALQGNVIDLAVGVIIGGALQKIVTSLVNDIVFPLIGIILGGYDFRSLKFSLGSSTVLYGAFIQNVVDFLIVALVIFLAIRMLNRIARRRLARLDRGEKK